MDPTLKRLMGKMPPPITPPDADVDWERLESAISLTYPASFKEFIGVYGSSVWCDHLSPFYSTAKTDGDVKKFLKSVKAKLKPLESNIYDEHFNKLDFPLYPAEEGLFPFMIDYSSSLYCWQTEKDDPNKWPIVCWFTGQILILEKMTITKMILEWLERKPRMVAIWGDVNNLPPERIQLT